MGKNTTKVYDADNTPVGPVVCAYDGESAADVVAKLAKRLRGENASTVLIRVGFDENHVGEMFFTLD